jgi:hypothetical protein
MKKIIYTFIIALSVVSGCFSQEYATYEITGLHQGNGSFENAALSDFEWTVSGTLTGEVQIPDNEIFDDGSAFENVFGQADDAQNLRIQVVMNGPGTAGQPLTSSATLTLLFDQPTPVSAWGFCLVDIDVENCLVSAIDENDDPVSPEIIDGWLVELFDANLVENGVNIPKWDAIHAALLGSDTPDNYVVYNNLVIGGMPSSEAPAAYFMPDLRLKSLTITFENLQDVYHTSYHFYIASLEATMLREIIRPEISIYPVPACDVIRISTSQMASADPVVEIFNPAGDRLILKVMNQAKNEMELDISRLPAGVYFCRVLLDRQTVTKKIVKL